MIRSPYGMAAAHKKFPATFSSILYTTDNHYCNKCLSLIIYVLFHGNIGCCSHSSVLARQGHRFYKRRIQTFVCMQRAWIYFMSVHPYVLLNLIGMIRLIFRTATTSSPRNCSMYSLPFLRWGLGYTETFR